ncbi:MAG: 5'/3'-nucleotidase SurE [Planctomycetota bacterium]
MPKILLTNDDGIEADGLKALADCISDLGELTIAAPSSEQSGVGHAITLRNSIRIAECPRRGKEVQRLSIGGTPADAVRFALRHHLQTPPDLVVSGPNTGPNVGVNIHYSGTLGASFEAAICGVSAVAISSDLQKRWNWKACCHFGREVVVKALEWESRRRTGYNGNLRRHPEPPTVFNLNVPALPLRKIKGIKVTRHGMSGFEEFFVPPTQKDPDDHYRIDGHFHAHDPSEEYDTSALMAGYASLTPLQLDLTHHALVSRIQNEWFGEDG